MEKEYKDNQMMRFWKTDYGTLALPPVLLDVAAKIDDDKLKSYLLFHGRALNNQWLARDSRVATHFDGKKWRWPLGTPAYADMERDITHTVLKAKAEVGLSDDDGRVLREDLALQLVQKIVRLIRSRLRRKVAIAKKKLIKRGKVVAASDK